MTRYLAANIVLILALAATGSLLNAPTAAETLGTAETSDRSGGSLGTVRIAHRVKADGKELAPGVYEVRLTDADALPTPAGETVGYERWVEFVQRGGVKGREVATIVPANEMTQVVDAGTTPPRTGQHRIEVLKGDAYLRIWLLRGGRHYLIHLPILS